MAKKPYIIALEEHYQDPEVKQLSGGPGAGREIVERLDDLGALRIREMDEAGIDLQVLSHSIPGLQVVDAEAGPDHFRVEFLSPRAREGAVLAGVGTACCALARPRRICGL